MSALAPFFIAYCTASFFLRLAWRRWQDRISPALQMALGCVCLAAGQLTLLQIDRVWHVGLPAVLVALSRTLLEPTRIEGPTLLALAVFMRSAEGATVRLIDNRVLQPPHDPEEPPR